MESLLDLLGALSIATDVAAGFPRETALRTSVIAHRLARAAGMGDTDIRAAGVAGLLRYLGCTGSAHEGARFGAGSDMAFLQMFADADFGSPIDVARRALELGAGAGLSARASAIASFARPGVARLVSASHCEVAERLAAACGVSDVALVALGQIYERHDGRGQPHALAGDAISRAGQVVSAAQTIEVVSRTFGPDTAVDVARRRGGGQPAPVVVEAFTRDPRAVLAGLESRSVWDAFRDAEPHPRATLTGERIDDIALAFAHFADVKSTFLLGHSVAVAELAVAAVPGLGAGVDVVSIRRASLLHDLGRVSIENRIWDRPGPLGVHELAQARGHSYETERLLGGSALLSPLTDLVGAHEQLDGSGYHRRVSENGISLPARLLAVCDVWCALAADRPWRRAHAKGKAVDILGQTRPRRNTSHPSTTRLASPRARAPRFLPLSMALSIGDPDIRKMSQTD